MGQIVILYLNSYLTRTKFVSKIFVDPKFITGVFEQIFPDISRTNLDFPAQKGVIVYIYVYLFKCLIPLRPSPLCRWCKGSWHGLSVDPETAQLPAKITYIRRFDRWCTMTRQSSRLITSWPVERAQQATQLIVTCSGSVHQAPRALYPSEVTRDFLRLLTRANESGKMEVGR